MPAQLIENGKLELLTENGASNFLLSVPDNWRADQNSTLLFYSPDGSAFFGFIQNSEFDSELDLLNSNFPVDTIVDEHTVIGRPSPIHSLVHNGRTFEMRILDKVKLGSIDFLKFSGNKDGIRSECYFTQTGAEGGRYKYDGFFCVYLDEAAFQSYQNDIQRVLASVHANA